MAQHPPAVNSERSSIDVSQRYLALLKKTLLGTTHEKPFYWPIREPRNALSHLIFSLMMAMLGRKGIVLARDVRGDGVERLPTATSGWLEATSAYTLLGKERLDNLQWCVEEVLQRDVPGDLIETGVWRGGACILMCAILSAYGVYDRRVFVADSFEGLPPPDPARYPPDRGSTFHRQREFSVSLEDVQQNFSEYGLLDERAEFIKGWFSDTLPKQAGRRWAVIRLDGDMYQSTIEGLENLYPGLSPGGFVIVDDFGAVPACRQAVLDYRQRHSITEEIHDVDWTAVYWQRQSIELE